MNAYLCVVKKTLCDMFIGYWRFITNSPLQLLCHDEVFNSTKGHYEPIIFHNISQLNVQNMLELTPMEHENALNNMGKMVFTFTWH
jgi:hypothetical protein